MKDLIKNCQSVCEFGGPSQLFEDIYPLFKDIDGYNLFDNNYWQKEFKETYIGNGKQFNRDIVNIESDKKYDLILNCHVIEHIANPLKALFNWSDMLTDNGMILSVIPDKTLMFDCNRELTTIEHLCEDCVNGTEEDDTTHIKDAIENFTNNGGYDYDNYVKSSKDNYKYRAIHHHCFNAKLVSEMFLKAGFKIIHQYQTGMHIWTLASK